MIRRAGVTLISCCASIGATADDRSSGFRSLDLNSYSLGANVYVSSSPYEGVENFVVVFPAPTRFGNPTGTGETFFVRDGGVGLRTPIGGGWDLGGLVSIQTLGYGSGQSPALAGMRRRDWTVQGGVTVGRQFSAIRADIAAETDLFDEHGGQEYKLKLARSFDFANHYLMPQFDATYQSSGLVNHYFGVRADEALPNRPEYVPGAAITYGASLEWGWRWHPRWFLRAEAGIDRLPREIRSSPIVDRDYTWSATIGIAYDAPTMLEIGSDRPASRGLGLEFTAGAFFVNADSKIFLTSGDATVPIDLESDVALGDTELSIPLDVTWRFNAFHRIEFGYFELRRSGAGDVVVPVDIGEVSFAAQDTVDTSFDTRIFKLGYAFSLWHDQQKELSVFGGVHISDVSFRSGNGAERASAETTALLPVLGADLRVSFTDRLALRTTLNVFVSDIDRYSGSLLDFAVSGQYALHERLLAGVGYRLYRQDIDSADESFFGDYRFQYRGPFIYISARL